MKLLLDTPVALWWFDGSPSISPAVAKAIRHAETVFVSIASAWETAIKASIGKLTLPEPFEMGIEKSQLSRLPIEFSHVTAVGTLPWHHRDPFDRMLIAQALVEGVTIVTHDEQFRPYGLPILWT